MLRCIDHVNGTTKNGFWLILDDQGAFIYRLGVTDTDEDLTLSCYRTLSVEEVEEVLRHWGHLDGTKLSIRDMRGD